MRLAHVLAALLLCQWGCLAVRTAPPEHLIAGDRNVQHPSRRPNGLHNPLHQFNVAKAAWHNKAHLITPGQHGDGGANGTDAAIQLDIQPHELVESGTWFTVTWSGVPEPDYDDLLALYVPADADITKTAPVKFKFCAQADPTHVVSGAGSNRFRLLNYRQDMVVVLMKGGLASPLAIAKTPIIRVLNPNEPLQGHLALTGDTTQMVVQWNTHNASQPEVRWGPARQQGLVAGEDDGRIIGKGKGVGGGEDLAQDREPPSKRLLGSYPAAVAQLPHTTAASTVTYSREDMCGGVATSSGWVDPGVHHSALLTGLKPGQRYSYSFGDPTWGYSKVYSFTAPPVPGEAVHILAVADMGQGEEDGCNAPLQVMMPSLNTTRRMHEDVMAMEAQSRGGGGQGHLRKGHMAATAGAEAGENEQAGGYSLLLHEGDLSYAEGFSATWDNFFHQLEPLTTKLPYMVSPGNHERDWPGSHGDKWGVGDSGGECGVPYQHRLAMPQPTPQAHVSGAVAAVPAAASDQPWHSFNHGAAHILHYSTEHAFHPGSPQHTFLLQDLHSVDRRVTPWVILAGHRPIYISSTNLMEPDGDQLVASELREALEGLLREYKVDLTLSGHHHSYQRTCPVFNGTCTGHADAEVGAVGEAETARQGQAEGGGAGGAGTDVAEGTGSAGAAAASAAATVTKAAEEGMIIEGQTPGAERRSGASAAGRQGSETMAAHPAWPGTVHLVIGHGGAPLSLNEQSPPPAYLAVGLRWWGYLRFHVSRTLLHAEVVSDLDGSVMDEFRLRKSEGWGGQYMAAYEQKYRQR